MEFHWSVARTEILNFRRSKAKHYVACTIRSYYEVRMIDFVTPTVFFFCFCMNFFEILRHNTCTIGQFMYKVSGLKIALSQGKMLLITVMVAQLPRWRALS